MIDALKVAKVALIIAVAAIAALALSGPGTRSGWWHFRIGLLMFAAAGLLGLLAVISGWIARRRVPSNSFAARASALAMFTGLAALLLPAYGIMTARRVPPIHDITTDLDDPPRFRAALDARGTSSNPAPDVIGAEVARQHRHGYADLAPLTINVPPSEAFQRAVTSARRLRWNILDVNERDMTLEATATTTWFGFRDDISVRVRPAPGGSRIDVRSTSRVGMSDAGANANRIRRFLRLMR